MQLDLGNSALWEPFWDSDRTAQQIDASTYKRIPDQQIPIQLETPVLAAYAESNTALPRWRSAGLLLQRFGLGITVGGNQDAANPEKRPVYLRQITLIQWPKLSTSFALEFQTHYWLLHCKLRLWQYTGPYIDTINEDIGLARIDILRTEAKLNLLLERYQ